MQRAKNLCDKIYAKVSKYILVIQANISGDWNRGYTN